MRSFSRRTFSALLDSSSAIASDPSVLVFLAAHEVGGGGGMDGSLLVVVVVVVEMEVKVEVGVGVALLKSLHHPPLLPGPV